MRTEGHLHAEVGGGVPPRLAEHLAGWIGQWPPSGRLTIVGNPRNGAPGWDGRPHPVTGVQDPLGHAVLGVPPEFAAAVSAALADGRLAGLDDVRRKLPELLGEPGHVVYHGIFRWSTEPAPLPDAGVWVGVDDPRVPEWLRPFGGQVLMAFDDDGRYLAGVGIKRHDPAGHELAVVTEPRGRGQGLARRLVAQAARQVLEAGAVPTYLHGPDNLASARVADAAGFPDRGWRVLGLSEHPVLDTG